MEFKQLKKALDSIISLSDKQRALILECAEIDTIGRSKRVRLMRSDNKDV